MSNLARLAVLALLTSCATDGPDAPGDDETEAGGDLGLGDMSEADSKADGDWGAALLCKPLPALPPLVAPTITLSIDGLTLHLTDAATGFDKVYPVGPGVIESNPMKPEYGESLSYFPILATQRQDFQITPSTIQPCKTWWTDAATGEKKPVFAGLPFLSFYGNYGIHGPIDNFRAPNGGSLRRGYVSHGCFRMEAADILEVYARIKGVAKVPVRLQREPERLPDRTKVDVASKWIGAECTADAECGATNGFCAKNPLTEKGFCSARCTTTCADRPGSPTTFCTADPNAPGKGMCVARAKQENFECRPYDHQRVATQVARFNNIAIKADVCQPASRGWVGDHCLTDTDCGTGTSCKGQRPRADGSTAPGVCTVGCDRFCADMPGTADTFCAKSTLTPNSAGSCLRQCTPNSNASECPTDMACLPAQRPGLSTVTRYVCRFD